MMTSSRDSDVAKRYRRLIRRLAAMVERRYIGRQHRIWDRLEALELQMSYGTPQRIMGEEMQRFPRTSVIRRLYARASSWNLASWKDCCGPRRKR
jgi:hypothetical protein